MNVYTTLKLKIADKITKWCYLKGVDNTTFPKTLVENMIEDYQNDILRPIFAEIYSNQDCGVVDVEDINKIEQKWITKKITIYYNNTKCLEYPLKEVISLTPSNLIKKALDDLHVSTLNIEIIMIDDICITPISVLQLEIGNISKIQINTKR